MAAARFEITGVSKAFRGSPLLDFFSLEIREGEFLSIVGPGGGGKRTLLSCVGGLDEPTDDQISIDGCGVQGSPDRLGIVSQNDVVGDLPSIFDNVLLIAQFSSSSSERVCRALVDDPAMLLIRDRHAWCHLSFQVRSRLYPDVWMPKEHERNG
jgi:ABC-type nitrate/sulfonate/bicarbonate transport system ATPase subunit